MSQDNRKIRFGLWYDFRNPPQWRQSSDRLYREVVDQIAWGERIKSMIVVSPGSRRISMLGQAVHGLPTEAAGARPRP
jgi:hypothetical protein